MSYFDGAKRILVRRWAGTNKRPPVLRCIREKWFRLSACCMVEKVLDEPEIKHEPGYKDDFRLSFYWEDDEGQEMKWSPDNESIYQVFEMWFKSEDEGYPDGYGSMWQLFFIALTRKEGRDAALENNQKKKGDALSHFHEQVVEHGDEIVAEMEELVKEAKTRHNS